MRMICRGALLVLGVGCWVGCDDVGSGTAARALAGPGNGVASQLRGYDLGPPFPGGFRDSGLVNGYAEGEWVPFVAVIEGRKLDDADALAGGRGDGRYAAAIIVPTYSPRHDANAISDLVATGTYGEGAVTPIPQPFDDQWLIDNGYFPLVLGAHGASGAVDVAPAIGAAAQRTGPTRFGGQVSSASVPIEFDAPADESRIELRFAVRLALPDQDAIAPDGQTFPGTAAGSARGAADFFPGPGPIFVGYEVNEPTGIATVPIRVERHTCEGDAECPPGEECGDDGHCVEPCTDDSSCPIDEVCEDGECVPPPPPCEEETDCHGDTTCVGGYCLPDCPDCETEDCSQDPEPCNPGGGEPPCVRDEQCDGNFVCEDGVCQPCIHPCDVSCRYGDICVDGICEPPPEEPCQGGSCEPPTSCTSQYECAGGELCEDGVCEDPDGGTKQCQTYDDCDGNPCIGGVCAIDATRLDGCDAATVCPAGEECRGGRCERLAGLCELDSDCADGEQCLSGWCGRSCAGGCGGGETCVLDRCAAACTRVSQCLAGEACYAGGCVTEFAFVGHPGGDQSLWILDGDTPRDSGGCAASGSAGSLSAIALALLLVTRRRRRRPGSDHG